MRQILIDTAAHDALALAGRTLLPDAVAFPAQAMLATILRDWMDANPQYARAVRAGRDAQARAEREALGAIGQSAGDIPRQCPGGAS